MNKDIVRAAGMGWMVDCVAAGLCPTCNKPINQADFKDALSRREFGISGMCQECRIRPSVSETAKEKPFQRDYPLAVALPDTSELDQDKAQGANGTQLGNGAQVKSKVKKRASQSQKQRKATVGGKK